MPVFGATPADWARFGALGLTQDLLPVVSNPAARISPSSALTQTGKVPSMYDPLRGVRGIARWTSKITTQQEVARWAREPDYGICVQTRNMRALDVDISDPATSSNVRALILTTLGYRLPERSRANSGKFLLAFFLCGEYSKRVIKTEHGAIEFLAAGQQFVACGTHPSGARYDWGDQTAPSEDIPVLTPEEFESLWVVLVNEYATSTAMAAPSVKIAKLASTSADPVVAKLEVLSQAADGRLDIVCPFAAGHSTPNTPSSTSYYPPHTGGYVNGHFHCLHASCADRSDEDFLQAIGVSTMADGFEDVSAGVAPNAPRFTPIQAANFAHHAPQNWFVKGVLPRAEIAVVYGPSGSGKSFWALDISMTIAQGALWVGYASRKGRVVYIAAEGVSGARKRFEAYAIAHGVSLSALDIYVIPDAPNFMRAGDSLELIKCLKALGGVDLVVVDTWAQTTVGGDENSGRDLALALSHCRAVQQAVGATFLIVHHSGKDATKGARGHSSLRAAIDAEYEVLNEGGRRTVTVTKMKDGEDGARYAFHLTPVCVGMDEDGDAITSCVVAAG